MKLFGSTTSPYVRKVRVVMAEKKLEYQFEPTDVWAADTDIAATNPLGCSRSPKDHHNCGGLFVAIRFAPNL